MGTTLFSTSLHLGGESAWREAARLSVPEFSAVYAENIRYLWRAARALGIREDAVDDVLQDVFVVVHAKLGEFEPNASIRTWLMSILVRVVANHRRREGRRAHEPLPEKLGSPDRDGPDRHYAAKEQAELLDQLLASLDDQKRAVFVMAEIQEMSCAQIAGVLGIPEKTAATRLHRARLKFEGALGRLRTRERKVGP